MHVKRRLQLGGELGEGLSGGTCVDGEFTFSDGGLGVLTSAAFDDSFQPICSCSEKGLDTLDALSDPSNLDQTNLTALVADINALIGQIDAETENSCVNSCEACYEGGTVCAILETSSSSKISFMDGNLTLESLLGLASQVNDTDALLDSFIPFLEEFYFNYKLCLTYTKGESGKACLAVAVTDWTTLYNEEGPNIPCDLSYNGNSCSSCSIASDSQCLTASCSEQEVIDTCTGTGLEGPYQFLKFFYGNNTEVNDLITGSCDVNLENLGVEVPVPSTPDGGEGGDGGGDTSGAPFTSLLAMILVVFVVTVTI
jgi:hypothetical protein